MRIIYIDLDRCIGCRNCEQACSLYGTGGFRREDSNIRVNLYPGERFISTLTCSQCETPPCMEICPSGALSRDPRTGAIVVDQDRCVGCKMCMMACPFGNIHFNTERHVIQKCNLCEGEPRCIMFCMPHALNYIEAADLSDLRRRIVDNRLMRCLVVHQ
ncbi:MAG: 4Fe-4S dicluster domain-containing protein [Deltaproteobacteria bacterium]|nr:4Fe-4S dicluster domain-containing protein [Deltaproteobacteria bacterium]MBW2123560.1 4Fe-4S dicluster domain-containing protein [Deltaproteobacteria bacterium]